MSNIKAQRAWKFYDWANSVYSLVISTALFPMYYAYLTKNFYDNTFVVFGHELNTDAMYSWAMSIAFIVVSIISPILSGVADRLQNRKAFMKIFCWIGSMACVALFFYTPETGLLYGLFFSVLAAIGFWGSLVFYNSFLPLITTPDEMDKVSAGGYVLGYLGSSILLILCLVVIFFYAELGMPSAEFAQRFGFLITGLWWIGFAQITFRGLQEPKPEHVDKKGLLTVGIDQMKQVFTFLSKSALRMKFLGAYFFLSIGVQTIIVLAALFGSSELGLGEVTLIMTILIIQFVAMAGASFFAYLSSKLGNIYALMIAVTVWAFVCGFAYTLKATDPLVEMKFYIMGGLVGLVMGGVQSLSRSTYSKLIPSPEKSATFFSFYDVTEKIAIVVGTILFGVINQITGSMALSAMSLGIFFVLSFILLGSIKDKKQFE